MCAGTINKNASSSGQIAELGTLHCRAAYFRLTPVNSDSCQRAGVGRLSGLMLQPSGLQRRIGRMHYLLYSCFDL